MVYVDFFHFFLQQPCEVGAITTPILQMRKLKATENLNSMPKIHRSKWLSLCFDPSSLTPESSL